LPKFRSSQKIVSYQRIDPQANGNILAPLSSPVVNPDNELDPTWTAGPVFAVQNGRNAEG
jgi:hypothetical protein